MKRLKFSEYVSVSVSAPDSDDSYPTEKTRSRFLSGHFVFHHKMPKSPLSRRNSF